MLKIAIIDSGIDYKHQKLQNCSITGISILKRENKIYYSENFEDKFGHGTACAGIVHRLIPEAEIIAVRIFEENFIPDEEILTAAIKWCVDNNTKLISISLGIQTNNPSQELINICKKAYKNNILIIAASHNDTRVVCYPAYLPTVFGVASGKVKSKTEYKYIPDSPIEFLAKGNLQKVLWKDQGYNFTGGTSFACPHLTGIIGNFIEANDLESIDTIKSFLIYNSHNKLDTLNTLPSISTFEIPIVSNNDFEALANKYFNFHTKFNWVGNIAFFPISEKELSTISKFPDQIVFNNTGRYDYPKQFHQKEKNDDIFNPVSFDTIVIGYYYEHLFEANLKYGNDLVESCILQNKNFFVFDSSLKKNILNKIELFNRQFTGQLYMPEINKSTFQEFLPFLYLPEIDIPIIAVIGTSNKQGKFTTQLRLKEILKKEGYNVAHISTEPMGELVGAQFSYPIGKNSTVNLPSKDRVTFLRILIKAFNQFLKPHIILTGTQGWVVPRSINSVSDETQILNYLYGIQPDGIICCINPEDSLEEIKANVETTIHFTKSKLLFYALSPIRRSFSKQTSQDSYTQIISEDEYNERLGYFRKNLKKKVINIMDRNNDILILEMIENTFSS